MTSDERIEIAARLRKANGITAFVEALGIDHDSDWYWTDVSRRVADLIDPTCTAKLKRVVVDEHYRNTRFIPTCSVCGSPLDGGIGIPRFCPGCGARRVPRKVTHRCK